MKDNEYTMEMFGIVMQHLMLLSISGQLIMDAEVISIVNDCSKNTPYAALLIIKQPINLCSSQEALLILIFESLFCIMQCISVAFIKHILYDIYSVAHLYHNNSHLNPMEPQQHVHLHAEQAVAHLLNLNYSHLDKINVNLAEYTQITEKFDTAFNTQKYKAQQKFNGIDIFSGTMVMEAAIGEAIYGQYFNSAAIGADINYDIKPVITSDDALQIAMNNYNVVEEQLFGSDLNTNIKLNIYYSETDNIYYLAYIIKYTFKDSACDDVYRPFSVINAKNGDIIYSFKSMISSSNDNACGDSGNPKIGKARICSEITAIPDIKDENIEVYNHIGLIRQELFQCKMDSINNNICEIDDYEINDEYCSACDVYKAGQAVFSLYNEWMDIKPLSDENIPVELYVHYGTDYENAFWSGSAMYFGDGFETYYPLVSIDIVGHEMAHGFTEQLGSDLLYTGQSGGINEAYSDLVGEVTEYFIRGETDWRYGYDIVKNPNGAVKYMYDPPLDGKSIDHINDYVDGMNVHYSSGIYNKAFYLLQSKYNYASDPNKCTGINVCNTESVTDNILAFTESVPACTITTSTTSPTMFSVREGHAIIAYLFLFIFEFF